MTDKNIYNIFSAFIPEGEISNIKRLNAGLINTTFLISSSKGSFILQKINTGVFKDVDKVMSNIFSVTGFMRKIAVNRGENPDTATLDFIVTAEKGRSYYRTENGECWRLYKFIDDSYTVNESDNMAIYRSAGAVFGKFLVLLDSFNASGLYETIPDFHNTPKRLEAFEKALKADAFDRAKTCREETDFILERRADAYLITDLISCGRIPLRVTHNDTKINNVLFKKGTEKGLCAIDLDTVMPGSALYDFGDCVRSGANKVWEDSKDLSAVALDAGIFKAIAEGYLSETAPFLTEAEIEYLPESVKIMTYELSLRFLTDYLMGDVYFPHDYPEHNLDRAKNQLALVKDTEKKLPEMKKIISDIVS